MSTSNDAPAPVTDAREHDAPTTTETNVAATAAGHWDGLRPVGWPAAAVLTTARLRLEPVSAAHADAMAEVLADPALYTVIGGEPPDAAELRRRYTRWEHPVSGDGSEGWLNWVVHEVDGGAPVGTVQATVVREPALTAHVAWVTGTPHQGRGYAVEAALAMIDWLVARGVTVVVAHVAPGHTPSERVAARVGLRSTGELDEDGEVLWAAPASELPELPELP